MAQVPPFMRAQGFFLSCHVKQVQLVYSGTSSSRVGGVVVGVPGTGEMRRVSAEKGNKKEVF